METMEVRSPKKGVWRESLKEKNLANGELRKKRDGGFWDEEMPGRNGHESLFVQVT